jgi:alanine dehydrogenase
MMVMLSVGVIALSLALLPMSAVTVVMAAMAGLWWVSSGNGSETVQLSSLASVSEAESAVNGHGAEASTIAAGAAAAADQQVSLHGRDLSSVKCISS